MEIEECGKERGIDNLLTEAAAELTERWKKEEIHKGVSESETGLSSGNFNHLILLQKEGALTDGELGWLKGLRAELGEEVSIIIDDLLRKYPHLRRPTEMDRGKWIGQILEKFRNSIVN
jgi:hypothetical protein